jgi:hypothetical protein
MTSTERGRLSGTNAEIASWRRWGPYLSDRSWGTVREDYSANGDPWSYLPHDLARSKTYRWGEDGIAGFCDRYQILCWSMAFWNEHDPILKERFFGLVPSEGNHGEDVKEYYFYTDALPSHAYQRMLYKYPQRPYPYAELVEENRRRGGDQPEFELLDSEAFDDDRYFDPEIEVAKDDAETLIFRVRAHNRGPDDAPIHLLPHLWFRNVWSWDNRHRAQPRITAMRDAAGRAALRADDSVAPPLHGLLADTRLGPRILQFSADVELLFTDNETNMPRVFGSENSRSHFVKDAFHRYVVTGDLAAVNPAHYGTKSCARIRLVVPAGGSAELCMRLSPDTAATPFEEQMAGEIIDMRRAEADEYYASIHPKKASEEEKRVQRQAFAGMLWSKQSYLYDVDVWLDGDDKAMPPPQERQHGRNSRWRHLNSMRVLSMPDKWEYPWFAAWDLSFHCVTLALIDPQFAKEQIWLLLFEQFQHPNGQIPAYEWEFSDLNPPVQAWAAWRVYNMDRIRSGKSDREFLERCFHKLMLNFTWWVNKVDREGNNVFEGGFLGLDNITLVDRSVPFPDGAVLEQSDATGWMGMFSLVMMRVALELAREDKVYEALATKFFEHYVYIGAAMKVERHGETLWNEDDGFFYDLLRYSDGTSIPFRVRSLVGLIPLYAVERLERDWIKPFPIFSENFDWFFRFRKSLVESCVFDANNEKKPTYVLAVVDEHQLRRLLARVVDPDEFLSAFGVRSLSRHHAAEPFHLDGAEVRYEPGEATSKIKGGNSNWRGPVWLPTSFLIIETLRKLEKAFGEVTVMLNSGETLTLSNLGRNIADRMISIFIPDVDGYRPLNGPRGTRHAERFAHDPHWKDLVLFYEYFHGDTGEGLGASHQTGWTGLVANLIDEWRG